MMTINDKINHAKLPPQTQTLSTIPDVPNHWIIANPQHIQQSTEEKSHQEATLASTTQQLT
jgi:hypothetical protein